MRAHPVRPGLRSGVIAVTTALLLLLLGCSSDSANSDDSKSDDSKASSKKSEDSEDDGGYAFDTDREEIAYAVGKAFSNRNGTAEWEKNTLVLTVDGDAEDTLAGLSECTVLDSFIKEGDKSAVEFPNGRLSCEEVLAGE